MTQAHTDHLVQIDAQELRIIKNELRRIVQNNVAGDVVEFGCYIGTTSVLLQREITATQKVLHVYDSFEGLPKKTMLDHSILGEQFREGALQATKKQLVQKFKQAGLQIPTIHKAWFSDLSDKDIPTRISFAFLDGDYYESIYTALCLIWPRLQPGSVVVVDDYSNESLPGVQKAVDAWLTLHAIKQLRTETSLAIINV